MNKIIRLLLVPVLLAPLCAAAGPGSIPLSSLQLNGWAYRSGGGIIRLTRNSGQASSAFVPTPFALGPNDSFAAFFIYNSQQELGQCVADGLAFVAQNTSAGPGYLGMDGSGLGFFSGTNSPAIGVTFDYYANSITGTPPNAAAIATPAGVELVWTSPDPPALAGANALRHVWIFYQNSTKRMQVYYSATPVLPATPLLETTLTTDLSSLFGGQVYFGVTAGTGSCYSRQFLTYLAIDVNHQP